jgi:Polyketide cyclase / dehydrase and lipid transport
VTKITTIQEIQASSEKIFAFIMSERMNEVWGEWMIGKWDSQGPVKVGSTGHFDTRGTFANFGKLTGTVTEFDQNKKMTLQIKDVKGKMDASDTLILEPTSYGTKITYVSEYKVPYSVIGKLIDKIKISKTMESMHVKMLENLKKAIET